MHSTYFFYQINYYIFGDYMIKVEIFDEEHEKDLQKKVNDFILKLQERDLVDIKYQLNAFLTATNEQIYCYSAMIIYRD